MNGIPRLVACACTLKRLRNFKHAQEAWLAWWKVYKKLPQFSLHIATAGKAKIQAVSVYDIQSWAFSVLRKQKFRVKHFFFFGVWGFPFERPTLSSWKHLLTFFGERRSGILVCARYKEQDSSFLLKILVLPAGWLEVKKLCLNWSALRDIFSHGTHIDVFRISFSGKNVWCVLVFEWVDPSMFLQNDHLLWIHWDV